jgi:coenzyme F420-reducing hydrogenase alpha subunit
MPEQRIKIGILDLTCCTGCEVNLLRLGAEFLDIAQAYEIVNWRMVQEEKWKDYDVVLVEGYACNEEQEELLRLARESCEVVVALGTCAISGNVFSQLTPENYQRLNERIYVPAHRAVTKFVRPVHKVVKVDHVIPGCPASTDAAKHFLEGLRGRPITSLKKEVRQPDYISKIEGHGSLHVDYAKGVARFCPEEGERFVEGLVLGKPYLTAPKVHSRICGICPVAHCQCSIIAIEMALDVRPTRVARYLGKLFSCVQIVQSHLLHLYFMVLPSVSGMRSSLDMSIAHPAAFHLFLNLKRICEELFDLIGGAHLHPVSLTPGGFKKVPAVERLLETRDKIEDVFDEAMDLVSFFSDFEWPEAITTSHMLCIHPGLHNDYPQFGQQIDADAPEPLLAENYKEFLEENIYINCPSKEGMLIAGMPVKSGALARLSRYWTRLHPRARKALEQTKVKFTNPFHNNLAQAVEIVHFLEEAVRIIDRLWNEDLQKAVVDPDIVQEQALKSAGPWPKRGVAAIEAPRGLLIHDVSIDHQGRITDYNIIPPTALNLSGLNEEATLLIQSYSKESAAKKRYLLEELIRAVDPCITCAVH